MRNHTCIKTVGDLERAGCSPTSIKQGRRRDLIAQIPQKNQVVTGIWGYEETVIPDLERAILAGHDINLLGLRGQAKTRLARLMVHLLDEYIPVIKGSELNDDPLQPVSRFGIDRIAQEGDDTPISW